LILPPVVAILNYLAETWEIFQTNFQPGQVQQHHFNYQACKEAEMSYSLDEETGIEDGRELDLEMLREDLMAELEAINQYQEHIETLEDEEAIRVLEHIRDDEKEHVAELVKLIQTLDPIQAEKFTKGTL
jgi:hypothetical protein